MEYYLLNKRTTLEATVKTLKNSIFLKEDEITNLKLELDKQEIMLREKKKELIEICNHKWERDYIDSMKGYKLSQPIRHCLKCELTDCTMSKTT